MQLTGSRKKTPLEMNNRKENFYVITGGPGVGKTTLLKELAKNGFEIVPEDAREIIKTEVQNNGDGVPWKNKERYIELMFKASIASYETAKNKPNVLFFDRGMIDTLCYSKMIGLGITSEMNHIVKAHLYNRKVFILPPWQEIYHRDNERKQTWEEATLTFAEMKVAYINFGYQLIEVPIDTLENRVLFIIKNIIDTNKTSGT